MFSRPFLPHRFLRNGHLQTICGTYWPDRWQCRETKVHRVDLPDGDAVLLHENAGYGSSRPLAVLFVHGLGGSHASGYVRRTAAKLNAVGVRTFRIDMRGHGAAAFTASRPGHAGRSEDIAAAAEFIQRLIPAVKLVIAGFSLGGNIVLKMAGEFGQDPPAWITKVLAVAPPIDLTHCSANLATRQGLLYDRVFVKAAIARVKQLHRLGIIPGTLPRRWPGRLVEFDDCFTAPRSGFRDVADYYAQCSSAPRLADIQLPTTIVSAADDPIVPGDMFASVKLSASTHLVLTPHGGHLGYLARRSADADRRWLDWRIVEWVLAEQDD